MKTTKGVKELVALSLLLFPLVCDAKVTGQCGNCHTMHFSQGGVAPLDADLNPYTGPNEALLYTNCIGCHQGDNSGGVTPFVLDTTGAPTYGTNTLAGGNFYWVAIGGGGDDNKGHNVAGISAADGIGTTPPGWNAAFNANTQVAAAGPWGSQLTCAGTYGCHGMHGPGTIADLNAISGAHHENNSTIDGSTTGRSFRFLYGITGIEDDDWEYTSAAGDHNQYFGYDRANDTPPVAVPGKQSINYLCAECHGDFHSGDADDSGADTGNDAASPWLRHPTDFDMRDLAAGSEYRQYGDGGVGVYNPLVPLATDNATLTGGYYVVDAVISDVFSSGDGDALVSCISCHRAHGSPYADLLRWDYKSWPGGGYNGCAVCHTTKD
ncbi:MAG: hypothetical protein MUO63_06785 [Desulfobulbaceae bacterium]|nr:hypothetical protein [Desulfobulbaceae bacterium]